MSLTEPSLKFVYYDDQYNAQITIENFKKLLNEKPILVVVITEHKKAEDQLRISKKQAEAVNQAKTQFLANMSYEIRTPLNSIVGFSQILMNQAKEYQFSREVQHYLENIQISGQNLSELINNILDLHMPKVDGLTATKQIRLNI
ncbi:Signal transduction histidine kinase [Candidatus Magnetomorum sp. HK-1]|nr:Signal transduction histidine kinase [Candidatus Magnetomorum sp. HK-1]